jgi:N-acetylglucosaminyldiphosphoundecaprenol N-acetyl-beta-D-mannosaminyltransferase
MRRKYFNVVLEFDKNEADRIIQSAIENREKGYVCSIESNNLTIANRNQEFLNVVNGALVNICDGSVIAKILGQIHHRAFSSYIGADLFLKYVGMCRYKQFFLGNTRPVLDGLRENLSRTDPKIAGMRFEELPFRKVDEFDYPAIAAMINADKPDIIWVSLGAPKQEMFMARLLPYLDGGVMFGFGAIFNFNSTAGQVRRAPRWMLKLKLEWLHRALEEPRKNVPRYWRFIKLLTRLIVSERRSLRESKCTNEATASSTSIPGSTNSHGNP